MIPGPAPPPQVTSTVAGFFEGLRRDWWAIVLVLAGFAAYGCWRTPVPGVNEPHYLAKARHFHDPAWCARDLFLQSADAHWVFHALIGELAGVASFPVTAWVGRALVWSALAIGWIMFVRALLPGRFAPVWGAALLLASGATGNLSGEWLIGGVEAKGFSYALLFVGLALGMRGNVRLAGVACGGAISFHPVVGIWGVAALAFAAFAVNVSGDRRFGSGRIRAIGNFVIACGVCSLPGLIPAIAMLGAPGAREASAAADALQVFDRLDHHLDPVRFSGARWGAYGALTLAWLATRPWKAADFAGRLFCWFIIATLGIAAGGLVIGLGPRWAWALKFYPFRLADLFVPIAVSLAAVGMIDLRGARSALGAARGSVWQFGGHALAAAALAWAMLAPGHDRNPSGWTIRQNADWKDACRYIAGHTETDALFLTPRYGNYTFKWYAQRAEYAIWKDCPQDAPSLVEWKRRLDVIVRWRNAHFDAGFDEAALAKLREATQVDYVIDWYFQPYRVSPVYRNRSFRVYRVPAPDSVEHARTAPEGT
jgi:hypothetical protein